ncbi:MAG: hypothetical protein KGL16_02085, partial [Acidobacteriota bacterium]|nr:hypothetical protein [Acidobacteriota bacterium]
MEPASTIRIAQPARPQAGPARKASGASWALADQCIVSGSNFVTIYLFARCLQPSVFGEFVLGYTALLLLTGLQGALVTQPHNVLAAALARRAYRRFTGAMAIAQLALCVVLVAALGAASVAMRALALPAAAGVLSGLAAAAAPWFGQEFVRRVLYTRGESRSVALNDLLTYGLQLAGTLTLLVRWPEHATPQAGLLVLGISSAAG